LITLRFKDSRELQSFITNPRKFSLNDLVRWQRAADGRTRRKARKEGKKAR
jgi:hypothetical protein